MSKSSITDFNWISISNYTVTSHPILWNQLHQQQLIEILQSPSTATYSRILPKATRFSGDFSCSFSFFSRFNTLFYFQRILIQRTENAILLCVFDVMNVFFYDYLTYLRRTNTYRVQQLVKFFRCRTLIEAALKLHRGCSEMFTGIPPGTL